MPTYEYKCTDCEQVLEVQQSMNDDDLKELPGCKVNKENSHQLKKIFSSVGISFKGDGFYINDSKNKNKKVSEKTKSTETNSKTPTKDKSDTKSNTKANS